MKMNNYAYAVSESRESRAAGAIRWLPAEQKEFAETRSKSKVTMPAPSMLLEEYKTLRKREREREREREKGKPEGA